MRPPTSARRRSHDATRSGSFWLGRVGTVSVIGQPTTMSALLVVH